jgi:16S rRNA (cytosine967-C5)-methyltransferase
MIKKSPQKNKVASTTNRPSAKTPYNPAMAKAKALPSHLEHLMRVLPEMLKFDAPSDMVVSKYFKENSQLGNRDRALIAESSFSILRHKLELMQYAQSGQGPLIRRIALLGLMIALSEGGLGTSNRLESALADLAFIAHPGEVEWLQRFVTYPRDSLTPQVRFNLPDWLWEEMALQMGAQKREALAMALLKPATLDCRSNPLKEKRDVLLEELNALGGRFTAIPTPYSELGFRLITKPALQNLQSFKDGKFEVQDEGSQLLSMLLAPKRGEMVVDFCAGAGGKTLAMGAMMKSMGRLYAFDISARRLARLKPRVAKSGLSNVHPVWIDSENDTKVKRLAGKIDRVLVDAPCSGLGTLRRNPDLKWRQTPQSVEELQAKQYSILNAAAKLLKPGGRLVYATCSILQQENQVIVEEFLKQHLDFQLLDPKSALTAPFPQKNGLPVGASPDSLFWQLWPNEHETDGFFAAILERKITPKASQEHLEETPPVIQE